MRWLSFFKQYLLQTYQGAKNIRHAKWLGFLGPYLHHPRLWHFHKKGFALGVAIGVFFGFLIPIAQAPLSIVGSVLLRAHIPAAVVSTLVTNPITFAPVYYAAYQVGDTLRDRTPLLSDPPSLHPPSTPSLATPTQPPEVGWSGKTLDKTKSLALGLVIFAICGSFLSFFLIYYGWIVFIKQKRKRRCARYARHKG